MTRLRQIWSQAGRLETHYNGRRYMATPSAKKEGLAHQLKDVIPLDFSGVHLDLDPVRKLTLPYITPLGAYAWVHFGLENEFAESHFFTADIDKTKGNIHIRGAIPNIPEMKTALKQFLANGTEFEGNFRLSDRNIRELSLDPRLTLALGLELLDFVLSYSSLSPDERAITFPSSLHWLDWHTVAEVIDQYSNPHKTMISSYPERLVVSSKNAPDFVFNGRNWLVGRSHSGLNDMYLAQKGSGQWWELNTAGGTTVLRRLYNNEETKIIRPSNMQLNSYSVTNPNWPLWILHQIRGQCSDSIARGSVDFPPEDWQQASDFQVTVHGDMLSITDKNDPYKMKHYELFHSFNPLITADLQPADPAKGLMINELASLHNIMATLDMNRGCIDDSMRQLSVRIVKKIRGILSKYGSNPDLANELVSALQKENLYG